MPKTEVKCSSNTCVVTHGAQLCSNSQISFFLLTLLVEHADKHVLYALTNMPCIKLAMKKKKLHEEELLPTYGSAKCIFGRAETEALIALLQVIKGSSLSSSEVNEMVSFRNVNDKTIQSRQDSWMCYCSVQTVCIVKCIL
ncbi:CLUMA_CG004548, isoform A [Clunio marinus]|uniref:CLUMA_CG004548, isoform A n=1 Tax=Clunio marinus TaxID=568069 RepID=A0A1J1HTH1_9DIPT|nr:CLUMA_CG004548, isoform A [Clunio marinus]